LVREAYKLTLTKKLCFRCDHSSNKNTPTIQENWPRQNFAV